MIRRATAEDLTTFWGHPPKHTMKAHVIDHGGDVIAVGGIYYLDGGVVAFSDMKDEAAKHPKQIMRCARAVMDDLKKIKAHVYAKRDAKRPTSHGFLTHLGFVPLSDEAYVLNKEHHG